MKCLARVGTQVGVSLRCMGGAGNQRKERVLAPQGQSRALLRDNIEEMVLQRPAKNRNRGDRDGQGLGRQSFCIAHWSKIVP